MFFARWACTSASSRTMAASAAVNGVSRMQVGNVVASDILEPQACRQATDGEYSGSHRSLSCGDVRSSAIFCRHITTRVLRWSGLLSNHQRRIQWHATLPIFRRCSAGFQHQIIS